MPKVKTFTSDLAIFKTVGQLDDLDARVNEFLEKENVKTIYSVSDSTAADNSGATIGIVRVVAYD